MEEEIILMEENDIEEINIEEENYSGKPYELPIASKNVLGGIKVGKNLSIDEDGTLNAQAGGSGGTTNYEYLLNKPKINSVELVNNKTFKDLGINEITNTELEEIFKDL